ncbi:hypothetical protein SAY86_008767 [Trapa natans]|uniref:TAFII55 protein conserved region domain-containing protein n=1 Tax=Trapa natans TaxID=22666 RepID=A0AAN7K9Y2_TRANT|nr:hypothetical protein SAY86_008767 [Trapa natans]
MTMVWCEKVGATPKMRPPQQPISRFDFSSSSSPNFPEVNREPFLFKISVDECSIGENSIQIAVVAAADVNPLSTSPSLSVSSLMIDKPYKNPQLEGLTAEIPMQNSDMEHGPNGLHLNFSIFGTNSRPSPIGYTLLGDDLYVMFMLIVFQLSSPFAFCGNWDCFSTTISLLELNSLLLDEFLANLKEMEEQFILRVPPSVAERIERLLNEDPSSSAEKSLDLSFLEDGRNGKFAIGGDSFPASLLDLPTVVESYKTYDDTNLVKTADIGQIIMVREADDPAPDVVEYRHGLTPPMRDARKRRFRREPDLNVLLIPLFYTLCYEYSNLVDAAIDIRKSR